VAVFDTDFWSTGCNNELMLAINQPGANIDNRGDELMSGQEFPQCRF
jgi:hypothetical protein